MKRLCDRIGTLVLTTAPADPDCSRGPIGSNAEN